MAIFRSFSEIVNSIIERLKLTQPNLDTKPGTVSRDLFVDIPADQIEKLYSSLSLVAQKQSPELATGKDLDRWANNFGISRRPGSNANGIVVFTVNDISGDISIPSGSLVTARNGLQYKTIGSFLFSSAEKNKFAANANRLRSALNLAGINDSYALEVPVQAVRAGTSGNISTLQIIEHNLKDSVKITNLTAFNGGSNLESDAAFRARVFAIFSGANTGTSFGYRNAALSVAGVQDAIVIEPGDTLMLRDGTETIEINDGAFRILNSGTGGKVDIYILGNQLQEVIESFIFTDLSGVGNATDERNDIIPGLQGLEQNLTSEERRVQAFKDGKIPLQPIDSIVSIIGSSSGILVEKSTASDGTVSGQYELIEDENVETGGSPFGFDRVHFISSTKDVEAETIIKQTNNSVDALKFTDVNTVSDVYQDIQIVKENSSLSSADRSVIQLNHFPVVSVSRIVNSTTGEIYTLKSQTLDSETGLNLTGEITISGKTLPSTADILSVDYTWRLFFDRYLDYNGEKIIGLFQDPSVVDSIDWGVSNGIFEETAVIDKTDDGFEFIVSVDQNISRVISVYTAETVSSTVIKAILTSNEEVLGLKLDSSANAVENIVSIKNSVGTELYTTLADDGDFSNLTIIFPSDSPAIEGEEVSVVYNKVEFFDVTSSNGAFSSNVITLPSEDILVNEDIFDTVEDLYLTQQEIFVKYVADISELISSQNLTSFPLTGSTTSNTILNSSLLEIIGSQQPLLYHFDSASSPDQIVKFGPTRLKLISSGITNAGKIKITGTTLTRLELDVISENVFDDLKVNLRSSLLEAFELSSLPTTIGIARVDAFYSADDSDHTFDLIGQELNVIDFAFGTANLNSSLKNTEFLLPETAKNLATTLTDGEKLKVSLLVYNTNDAEDLYFPGNNTLITNKVFARVQRISVVSGFRNSAGTLVGSVVVKANSQPDAGVSYFANYNFVSPKEGERLTVRYNVNKLISDTTVAMEDVRSITADVLVKEAPQLTIDIQGEIIINSDVETSSSTIVENVGNAVVKLINSTVLGSTIDYSDIVNVATSVSGVDSVNVSLFNESGEIGRRTFIKALSNQNMIAGNISFKAIPRQDFRIT